MTRSTQIGVAQVLSALKSRASRKHLAHASRVGIAADGRLGVSTAEIRKLAKSLGRNHSLAMRLWADGHHEAKLLAVLLMEPARVTLKSVEACLDVVESWDLCDHIAANLVRRAPFAQEAIERWTHDERLFVKRAGYATLASSMVDHSEVAPDQLERYLALVEQGANDERAHVSKAVSWALRELGKVNFALHDRAVSLALDLKETGSRGQRRVGTAALRELEQLVAVPERRRLLTSKSKMGAKAAAHQRR